MPYVHMFFSCLHFLCTSCISSSKRVHSIFTCLKCLFIYLPYNNLIPSVIFCFSNKEDEQILHLRVIMKNDVIKGDSPCVYRTSYGITKILPTNNCFFLFFRFSMSQLAGFYLNDQMKFIYNISDFETAL